MTLLSDIEQRKLLLKTPNTFYILGIGLLCPLQELRGWLDLITVLQCCILSFSSTGYTSTIILLIKIELLFTIYLLEICKHKYATLLLMMSDSICCQWPQLPVIQPYAADACVQLDPGPFRGVPWDLSSQAGGLRWIQVGTNRHNKVYTTNVSCLFSTANSVCPFILPYITGGG